MPKQRYGINYDSSGDGYMVFDLVSGEPESIFHTMSEAIFNAQQLNGWEADGDKRTYARQRGNNHV